MPFRGGSSMARSGLPGLVMGLAMASAGDGGRGPAARAQPPLAAERAKMNPRGRGVGDAGLHLGRGRAAQLLYLIDTRTQAFAVYGSIPESQGDREAGGGPAVSVDLNWRSIITKRRRSPRSSRW